MGVVRDVASCHRESGRTRIGCENETAMKVVAHRGLSDIAYRETCWVTGTCPNGFEEFGVVSRGLKARVVGLLVFRDPSRTCQDRDRVM